MGRLLVYSDRTYVCGETWVAKELTTLDVLTDGRMVLGAGSGDPIADEYAPFGEPTDRGVLVAILDESLEALDLISTGNPITYWGGTADIAGALAEAGVTWWDERMPIGLVTRERQGDPQRIEQGPPRLASPDHRSMSPPSGATQGRWPLPPITDR